MKDVFFPLAGEFLRPLATLILPGCVAVTPYFILFCMKYPSFMKLVSANAGQTMTAFIAAALFVGFVLEDLGSEVEAQWDKADGKDELRENWNKYLRLVFHIEPVGHRYLKSIVLRLKFELNTFAAVPFAMFGTVLLWISVGGDCALFSGGLLVGAALMLYMYHSAKGSHDILARTRAELLKGAVLVGSDPDKEGSSSPRSVT